MVAKSNESPGHTASGEALLSPREHALSCGLIKAGVGVVKFGDTLEPELRGPEYRAADALHGWTASAQHSADEMKISRSAFDAAIEATKTADARGSYKPHLEALAPHLKKVETK